MIVIMLKIDLKVIYKIFFNPDININNNNNKEGPDVLMIRGFSDLPETPRARKL